MGEKKYFVLMKGGKDTSQVFASRQPRGAALKAATVAHRHPPARAWHQACSRLQGLDRNGDPSGICAGVAEGEGQIKKANVKKQRVDHLDRIRYNLSCKNTR